MDDIERAVDDGVNAFKALTKDSRTLPRAAEIELAHRLAAFGRKQTGLDQYAHQETRALEVVPPPKTRGSTPTGRRVCTTCTPRTPPGGETSARASPRPRGGA